MQTFFLFTYGTLATANPPHAMTRTWRMVGSAWMNGTLYDIDGQFPALMPYGEMRVNGIVWEVPSSELQRIDAYEETEKGLMRRIGTSVNASNSASDAIPCWVYVAGPRLAHKLIPQSRMSHGTWTPPQKPQR